MPRPKKDTGPMSPRAKVEEALAKILGQDAVDAINGADEEACKAKLGLLSTYENETETAKKEDPDILRLKEELATANAPYKETMKGIKLQRNLVGFRLEEMGKA